MTVSHYTIFAQAYGEGQYGECPYSENSTTCIAGAGGTGGSGSSGGGLVNTGTGAIALVTIACLIIFAALVVRIWRRPKKTNDS